MSDMYKSAERILILIRTAIAFPNKKEVINDVYIDGLINTFSKITPLSDEEKKWVRNEILAELNVRVEKGIGLTEESHDPWYLNAKKTINQQYWIRYKQYLNSQEGFSDKILNTLDDNTDDIVDYLGNPKALFSFCRKGLVIGDVQSGKTSTYLAVLNKAVDAGYRVIFILTGTIEKLRQQTQERVDYGLIGRNSKEAVSNGGIKLVGVGLCDSNPSSLVTTYTSTENDFKKKIAKNIGSSFKTLNGPVVFVLKKNKSILNHVYDWIRSNNNLNANKKLDIPMLLIDDEADNASVNTRKLPDIETTAINKGIRKLLTLFEKSNYVGFTATPYANIFINPDTEDEMLNADLFPKDFIYALKSPSNYVGASEIFKGISKLSDEGTPAIHGKYYYMLENNDDFEAYLPLGHKNGTSVSSELPKSLKKAIQLFCIANSIRDLRGDTTKHRTMMINVSTFLNVQESIFDTVDEYFKCIKQEIINYSRSENPYKHELFCNLKDLYDDTYNKSILGISDNLKIFSWEEIMHQLPESITPIQVRTVNGGNAVSTLNYDDYSKSGGLRIIAIGGLSLSRGLTLEGLIISYYYRNSKMYDTLMQMGRWFGYRKNYVDLCRIWMNEEAQDWYSYISAAHQELIADIQRMRAQNKTPRDFGLQVRSDRTALLVTAANKMRTAESIERMVNLAGAVIETKYISSKEDLNKKNFYLVVNWIKELLNDGYQFWNSKERAYNNDFQIKNIPHKYIDELLKSIYVNSSNLDFDPLAIRELVSDAPGLNDKWDVVIAKGTGSIKNIGDIKVPTVLRAYIERPDRNLFQISGASAHLGNKITYKSGLTVNEADYCEKKAKANSSKKELRQEDYFPANFKRNPLFVIWPVCLRKDGIEENRFTYPLIGFSMGFPNEGANKAYKVHYKINKIKAKEILEANEDDLIYVEEDNDSNE